MKNVVLLGLGLQGRAALHDLLRFGTWERILAADGSGASLDRARERYDDPRLNLRQVDFLRPGALEELLTGLGPGGGVVIDLLPIHFIPEMARQSVAAGWHYVNTYYTLPEVSDLASAAGAAGLALLPACGFDPGIDLVMGGHAFRQLDAVTEYVSYGAGVPEPAACDNPLGYKITWTFEGVLNSYFRAARLVRDGRVVEVPAEEIFSPESIHLVEIADVGRLEAFPNGDALRYLGGLPLGNIRRAGRYAMRWPGHARFWYALAKLGLLEDSMVDIGGTTRSQRKVLAALLEPKLQYRDGERDLAILRVEVGGLKNGREQRLIYELVDRRDLDTGLMAMNRTVGFTAAIGALMLAEGEIAGRGLLNPWNDIPYAPFMTHLAARGIRVRTEVKEGNGGNGA